MSGTQGGGWGEAPVPMAVLRPEQQRAMPGSRQHLHALHDEAMARFDAFCFWYARPPRTAAGLREVARRLESYGSPEALRLALRVREALAEG